MTQLLPPKKEVALALLERSNVDVYLDPRAKGVVVPPQFRKEPRLILKIGLNMPVPIPDLRLDDDSMSCTLSFNRSPFYCIVPWSSVFAMVGEDGRGMVWPDDVPQELAVKVVDPGDADADARPRGPLDRGAEASSGPSSASSGRRADSSRGAARPGRERGGAAAASTTEDTSGSSGSRAGSRRKKKKEEGPQRPVLVAVPSAPPSSPAPTAKRQELEAEVRSEASGSERPREIRQPPESRRPAPAPRDGVSAVPRAPTTAQKGSPPSQRRPPPPGAAGVAGPARPKRELPPYLRVVK